jgi:F0F1-type ATP synthase assembly protein I
MKGAIMERAKDEEIRRQETMGVKSGIGLVMGAGVGVVFGPMLGARAMGLIVGAGVGLIAGAAIAHYGSH